MANGIWVGSVNDSVSRQAVKDARITVTDPATGNLLGLYKDRAGTLPIGNPFLTREDGLVKFFARVGRVNVSAIKNGVEEIFENEIIADDWPAGGEPPGDVCDLDTYDLTSGTEFPGVTLYTVTYGAGVIVASAEGHDMYRSADIGATWDAGVTAPGMINSYDRFTGLAYGASTFVACGGAGSTVSVYSTDDGDSWSLATNGADLRHVVFGGGLFVAVGTGGTIKTSADGQTWTTRATSSGNLNSIAFHDGVFMCCGYTFAPSFHCLVLRSADGITWEEVFADDTWNDALAVAGNGNVWVVLSDEGDYETSTDGGETWVSRTMVQTAYALTSDQCWVYAVAPNALYALTGTDFALELATTLSGSETTYGKFVPGLGAVAWNDRTHIYAPP